MLIRYKTTKKEPQTGSTKQSRREALICPVLVSRPKYKRVKDPREVYQMYQHTRQHMPVRGKASASTARKLIAASQGPAQIILDRTEECDDYDRSIMVVPCRSKILQNKCSVILAPGQRYFMVRSPRFPTRWYVLTRNIHTGVWICSLRDVLDRCVAQVEAFLAARTSPSTPVDCPS